MANNNQSLLLLIDKIKTIQLIIESFLYYTRALDSTMLLVLNEIVCTQVAPTEYIKAEYQ